MKKIMTNLLAIIGLLTIMGIIIMAATNVYAKVNAKSELRKSNEYIYTQVDNLIDDISADKSITIEKCSNGDYRIIHNNGYVDNKYDTIYKNSGKIVEIRK